MSQPRKGRPPKYDRDQALDAAAAAFWPRGYSATTLDDLVGSMGMNRPSIYNAFGDKEAVYRQSLERFIGQLRASLAESVVNEPDLVRALRNLYAGALDVYFASDPSLGCYVFCTAPVEAVASPAIREIVAGLLTELDDLLAARFRDAQQAGTYPRGRDPTLAAKLAQGVLHSLAIRARAGESRTSLNRMAKAAAAWLAGA